MDRSGQGREDAPSGFIPAYFATFSDFGPGFLVPSSYPGQGNDDAPFVFIPGSFVPYSSFGPGFYFALHHLGRYFFLTLSDYENNFVIPALTSGQGSLEPSSPSGHSHVDSYPTSIPGQAFTIPSSSGPVPPRDPSSTPDVATQPLDHPDNPNDKIEGEQRLGEAAEEALKRQSINFYLHHLGEHNLHMSPRHWSQFPDDERPGDVENTSFYGPTSEKLRLEVGPSTVLQCRRCGTKSDLDFNIVEPVQEAADTQGGAGPQPPVCTMPYTHCPLKSLETCHRRRTPAWKAANARTIWLDKFQVLKDLQQRLLNMGTRRVKADVFVEDGKFDAVTREIFNAYRGCRVGWHSLSLLVQDSPGLCCEFGRKWLLRTMPVWGDLMTDMTLLGKGLIRECNIECVYGVSTRAAKYLYGWQSEWEEEVVWLDTYAGQVARMPAELVPACQRMAKKVGLCLEAVVDAEEKLEGKWEAVEAYRKAKVRARAAFRDLHVSMVCLSDEEKGDEEKGDEENPEDEEKGNQ